MEYSKGKININWEDFYFSQFYEQTITYGQKTDNCKFARSMLPQMIVGAWNRIVLAEEPVIHYAELEEFDKVEVDYKKILTKLLMFGSIILIKDLLDDEVVLDILYTNNSNLQTTFVNGNLEYLKYKKKISKDDTIEIEFKIIKNSNDKKIKWIKKIDKIQKVESTDFNLFPKVFNLDLFSSFGEPIYASAVNSINKFDMILNDKEYDRQESLPIVGYPSHLLKTQANQSKDNIITLDENVKRFRILPTTPESKQLPIEFRGAYNPINYREDLNIEMILISYACGFGGKYFTFETLTGIKTATEVVSEKDDIYKNKCLIDKVLEGIIFDINYYYSKMVKKQELYKDKMDIIFSDSIITNDEDKKERYYKDMIAGVLPNDVYMKLMGYEQDIIDEVAKSNVPLGE